MKKLLQSRGQMVFPKLCNCCNSYLSHQEHLICNLCKYSLPKMEQLGTQDNPLIKKFWGRLHVQHAFGLYRYKNKTQSLLKQLKYKNNIDLGLELGKLLGESIRSEKFIKSIDCIIAVPLHPIRELKRGYNQSTLLSQGMSSVLGIQINEGNLYRRLYNESQTKKSRYDRFENSTDIFGVHDKDMLKNKQILLVDDVVTTGSTLEACCNILLDIEGVSISIATIAVAY